MWIAHKPPLKRLGIFHFGINNLLKLMNLKLRKKKKRKVVQLNFIFSFILTVYLTSFTLQLFKILYHSRTLCDQTSTFSGLGQF